MTSNSLVTGQGRRASVRGRTFAGKHITVIGINYAPETTGIAPYTTGLCEFLVSEGADVTAIVGMPHYPSWRVDPEYRGRVRMEDDLNGVRIIRVGHYVPSKQSASRRGLYEGTFLLTSRLAARSVRPDAVIAVSPSLSALRTAAAVSRKCGAPFGAIVQDLMGRAAGQSGMQGGSRVAAAVGRSEIASLREADRIAVISIGFAHALVAEGISPDRISLMPNHTHIRATSATRSDARIQLGWDLNDFVVLHSGNMGLKQDLGNVIETARIAQLESAQHMNFVLLGDGSQRVSLEAQATGLSGVTFLPPASDHLYPIFLAAADVLVVNERDTVVDMSLPSKLTSYFAAGKAVLGAVAAGGASEQELSRSGAGVTVPPGHPELLLRALERLRDQPETRSRLGENGRQYAEAMLSTSAAHDRARDFVAVLLGTPLSEQTPVAPASRRPINVEVDTLAISSRRA